MTELTQAVADVVPGVLEDLDRLVRIPSISSLPDHDADVEASAELVAELLREASCPDVRIVAEGGKPAVIGRYPAPEGAPTICLYAHHDVQPTGERALWTHDPFTPTKVADRLFGRGTADDKGGIGVHLAALRAFDGQPPIGVTLFIEGEEEIGSPSLNTIIERHRDLLDADVFVIADSVNWQVDEPAFTSTLRGMARIDVTVSTLDHALHSGQYGGVVPDAMTAMIQLLATMHDEQGNVAVDGLGSADSFALDYDADRLRAETGLLDGVEFIGDGLAVDRMWGKPSVTVIGMDATPVALASNTLAPSMTAMVGLRVAPGRDAVAEAEALKHHLESHAPWGAHVTAEVRESGQPGVIPTDGPVNRLAEAAFRDAWGKDAVYIGCGGSIPMIAAFQDAFPGSSVLVTAVTDPDSRMHGIDESLHLGDFAKACLAETLLISKLAHT